MARKPKAVGPRFLCEAEVVTGLKDLAAAEIARRFGGSAQLLAKDRPEELPFHYDGRLEDLSQLDTVTAVYLVRHFPIPRPQALLGHQHFTELTRLIATIRSMHPAGTFQTFRISAAGRHSNVFLRIRDALAQATGLRYDEDEADLLLRVRSADLFADGWEVLARLTPRPLTARVWRVCNMEGALNATIASAMIALTQPRPTDRVFNPMCGSGTLLIERLRHSPAEVVGGCDTDLRALRCATDNLRAAGLSDQADLFEMDAAQLELPDACIDMICVDLPWGQLVGSHAANQDLYPQALAEMGRIAAPGARAVCITHEIRLMETTLQACAHLWRVQQEIRVFQGGLHPRIYLLERV